MRKESREEEIHVTSRVADRNAFLRRSCSMHVSSDKLKPRESTILSRSSSILSRLAALSLSSSIWNVASSLRPRFFFHAVWASESNGAPGYRSEDSSFFNFRLSRRCAVGTRGRSREKNERWEERSRGESRRAKRA